jgi:DNA-binding transcriptional LysR family regulator
MQSNIAFFAKQSGLMIENLRVFISAAETCNFSETARKLDVAVSSITRKIDSLERELGTRLFIRGPRRLVLTDSGEYFANTAQQVIAELAEAKETLASRDGEPHGKLTVTAPGAFGRRHLAPAIRSFLEKYPHTEIDLFIGDALIDLSVQRIDVAIRMGKLENSDLVATTLAPLRRLACASPSYLERFGRPSTPEELLNHQCLSLTTTPLPVGWWCFPGINQDQPLAVKGRFRSDDTDTLLENAIAGNGVVHLASWMVGDLIAKGELIRLFPDYPSVPESSGNISAVRLPGRSHHHKAKLFIDHLKSEFGTPPYWDLDLQADETTQEAAG